MLPREAGEHGTAIAIVHQIQRRQPRMRGHQAQSHSHKEVGGAAEGGVEGGEVTFWYLRRSCNQYLARLQVLCLSLRLRLRLQQGGEEAPEVEVAQEEVECRGSPNVPQQAAANLEGS